MKTQITKKELMTRVMRTAWAKFKANEKETFAECLKSAWKVVKNELNFDVYKKFLLKKGYRIWEKMNGEIEMSRIYINDFNKYIDKNIAGKYLDCTRFRKSTRKTVESLLENDLYNYNIKLFFDLISKNFKYSFYKTENNKAIDNIVLELLDSACENIRKMALEAMM